MAYWKTRGLRGSTFETQINMTNNAYAEAGLAIVQKVPTPITPVEFDKTRRVITLAYFEKQSTVDYIGAAQGLPICFEAKETARKCLPLDNFHAHQIDFMTNFEKQGGAAFVLVRFTETDECFFLPFRALNACRQNAAAGGRKSVPYGAFDKRRAVAGKGRFPLHYLQALDFYLNGPL